MTNILFQLFNHKHSLLFYCAIITTLLSHSSYAYEGLSKNPGTRAMGMAGVFAAQADDSSAMWYNPGAIGLYDYISTDFSMELGQRPVSSTNIDSLSHNIYENAGNQSSFNSFSAYTRQIPFISRNNLVGIGFGYFTPYNFNLNIDAPRNNIDQTPFGQITAEYHEISALISAHALKHFSIGATFDFIWTEIKCLQFQPCVQVGPIAIGSKLGVLYELPKRNNYTIKLSGIWHSKAVTKYISRPDSGIGTVINDYLPNRPNLFGFGASIQKPTPWMLITTNFTYEIVKWASSIQKGQSLSDYHNIGFSMELMSNISNGNSLGLRCGAKLLQSKESISSDALISAIGLGYEFKKSHIIDVAFEHRRFNGIDNNLNYFTLSYAWQKTK